MPNPIDFDAALDEYKALPNRIKFIREQILALDRGQLIDEMTKRNSRHAMSTETLRKLEREGGGSTTTVTRVLNIINSLLKDEGYEQVSRTQLLASW